MSQNTLDSNSTKLEVTDTEILEFYNLATMTLLRSLEVKNLQIRIHNIRNAQFSIQNYIFVIKENLFYVHYWGALTTNEEKNVMATLGPGWQMLDSFGFWWTWVNEIRNLSSFLQGGLNGGVRFYPTWYFALKNGIFQVKCRCHYAKKLVSWARDFKFWLQPCFFEPAQNIKLGKIWPLHSNRLAKSCLNSEFH